MEEQRTHVRLNVTKDEEQDADDDVKDVARRALRSVGIKQLVRAHTKRCTV